MHDRADRGRKRDGARGTIGLASAATAAGAVDHAISMLPSTPERTWSESTTVAIVAPCGWNDADARTAIERIRTVVSGLAALRRAELLRTPGALGQAAATLRETWVETALGPGAERFDRIRSPGRLYEATRLFVAPAGGGMPSMRPIAIAAAFAHPRQRAAARLAADPAALAELATPLVPALTVAIARTNERWLAAAATDPVAAELAWLGLAALTTQRGALVAWQDPAVQRLCLLGPFAQSPDDLILAPHASVDAATLRAFAEELSVSAADAPNPGAN